MNKFKKLFPATCLLLVACTLMGTSTFAWFSMNKTVTATDMAITAKSNTVFLQISGEGDNGAFTQEGSANLNTAVFPVSHQDPKIVGENAPVLATLDKSNITTTGDGTPWWYAYSADAGDSTKVDATAVALSKNDNFEDYVAHTQFKVNITSNSGLKTAKNLVVSNITIGNGTNKISDGVRVIIKGADDYVEFDASNPTGDAKVITNSIPKADQSTTVDVYIYIEGEAESTKTVNQTELFGSIDFELTCTPEEAN